MTKDCTYILGYVYTVNNIQHSSRKYSPRPMNRYLFIYIRGKA